MYFPYILILIVIILVLACCYPMQESYISYRRSYSRIQQGAQINHELEQIDEKIQQYHIQQFLLLNRVHWFVF